MKNHSAIGILARCDILGRTVIFFDTIQDGKESAGRLFLNPTANPSITDGAPDRAGSGIISEKLPVGCIAYDTSPEKSKEQVNNESGTESHRAEVVVDTASPHERRLRSKSKVQSKPSFYWKCWQITTSSKLKNIIKPDYSNAGGLVEWDAEAGEWADWYSEDGFDINEWEPVT